MQSKLHFQLPKFSLKPNPSQIKAGIFLAVTLLGSVGFAHWYGQTYSAALTSVSVTSTNVRPSFRGALTTGNTVGSSTVTINTTPGSYASTSSAQLVEGDALLIGSAGTLRAYTVASTSSLSSFSLTAALLAGDADSGDDVIATASSNLAVRFTTASAVNNGKFRVLVPALSGAASQNGIPDGGHFDFGTGAGATVTCPTDFGAVYDFVAGTATASAVTIGSEDYHSFTCSYSGTGAVGRAFDNVTSPYVLINNLINPAPATGHMTGTADSYSIIVQQLDNSGNVIDFTTAKIAVVEAVKVTAYVAPQLTFQIIGLASGISACGATTDVVTTAASVPFGELSLTAFKNAAQAMRIATNAPGGYAVTAVANDQLGRNGGTCTGDALTATHGNCIQDTRGDASTASDTLSNEWVLPASVGFGYALSDVNGTTTEAFAYNESARTFSARQFADAENSQAPVTIFSDTAVTSNDNIYVCYRVIPDATTAAGNYENYITYTATATF